MQDQNEREQVSISAEDVGTINGDLTAEQSKARLLESIAQLENGQVTERELIRSTEAENETEVSAEEQAAAQEELNAQEPQEEPPANAEGEDDLPEIEGEVAEQADKGNAGRERLYKDEEWRREGNNKKWRSPGVEKNRKKMAKASKKRNRRK